MSGLYVYPIKSAGAVSLESATTDQRGFRHDRRWMLVDGNGKLITQRRFPKMARISVRISEDSLLVDAPDMPTLRIPFEPASGKLVPVWVWDDETRASPVGEEADRWFGSYLRHPCRLVHMPDDANRPLDYWHGTERHQVSFADWFPFLLTSEASLADLNNRLAQPVPMDRFRPNIVVEGCGAFAEEDWSRIRIGDTPFRAGAPCARCTVVTIDQQTGARDHKEPLQTLARYRKVGGHVLFGRHLVHEAPGTLHVGDVVETLTTSPDDPVRNKGV